MIKNQFTKKVIAIFLTINFLQTIAPYNLIFANNNGPSSPEAAGFEPVDATDMVNLSTGDFTYVLPLTSVEGFPVNLSYHAGMTTDIDASWVGLGWYLNPGAINRSVTGTPDDWKSGVGINFNSYSNTTDYYGVTVDVGMPGASVGVGMNWGGGQGLSGSVSASLGLDLSKYLTGVEGGASISASASTSGDVTVGAGVGISMGSFQAGASISYSLSSQQTTLGVGVGLKTNDSNVTGFEKTSLGIGGSMSTDGSFSVGAGTNHSGDKGSASSGIGMSSSSFSQGDASVDVQSTGVALPLHVVGLPITLGFRKTKVKINIKKGFNNREWGALYSNDFYSYTDHTIEHPLINDFSTFYGYNKFFNDYTIRTRSMDVYSTRLPQSEEAFIADQSKQVENINFTFMGYDNYNVAAQGVMGNMTPNLFQNATIFGKGQRTKSEDDDDIHAFWHHGISTYAAKKGIGEYGSSYGTNDLYFYFNGQFTGNEITNTATINTSLLNSSNDINDLLYEASHSGTSASSSYYGRAKSPNFVEVFTNKEIADGEATLRGLITPKTIPNTQRDDIDKFDPNGIGGYKITSPDGKTYHFALPVYHFEQVQRGQIDTQEDATFDIRNVNEMRQYSRYATHWLLTAITGADYIDNPDPNDNNKVNTFNKEDYGYWVELEYGKWSDGFVWRTPYKDKVYEYNTNLKSKIETKDKGSYIFGRKQLYYLDKINTRNRTALFVKDIRHDALGKNLKYRFQNLNEPSYPDYRKYLGSTSTNSNSLNYTTSKVYVREQNVEYEREYSLKLSKIILVDSEVGKNLSKISSGTLGSVYSGYSPNSYCTPGWESTDFQNIYGSNYSYPIHQEQNILDVNDVSSSFITQNALQVIEFNHDYKLAQQSDSSFDGALSENPNKGKLTLRSVQVKGKGGKEYMPTTSFNYYFEDMENLSFDPLSSSSTTTIQNYIETKRDLVDPWGYLQGTYQGDNKIKAWSLKDITTPTGARIEVDYEEDNYWTEAFARRYWEDGLKFLLLDYGSYYQLTVSNDDEYLGDSVGDFTKYFTPGEQVNLDLFICRTGHYGWAIRRVRLQTTNPVATVESCTANNVVLTIDENDTDLYTDDQSIGWIVQRYWATSGVEHLNGTNDAVQMHLVGRDCPTTPGNGDTDHGNIYYRLLANKVPENETGGGLRVKELRTYADGRTYKATYDYSHPTENRSSGITSYTPIDGLKYVPYQSEVPAPGVMYEYVTMKETSNTGDYSSKTRYRHHVLKPVFNIFDPNIQMETLDNDPNDKEDEIFKSHVTENYGGLNGVNSRNVEAKNIEIEVNSAIIGQIKSIETINSEGHVTMKTENEYINGGYLINDEPNKGYIKERFNSMKTIFNTNADGTSINSAKRLLSISSKTEYNNMLKKAITIIGNQKHEVEYSDVDPWLGSFRNSTSRLADGTYQVDIRIPAYEKYSSMRSKVLNPSNRNMLTQEAMMVSSITKQVDANGDPTNLKTINANITTWNNAWNYRDYSGNETSPTVDAEKIWRRHKSYIWKDQIDPVTGSYSTNVNEINNYFDWGLGQPTNTKWQEVSEITRYNHWSLPIETKDINNNYVSTRMGNNESKAIAGGNARLTEMFYSGAEYLSNESSSYFDSEIKSFGRTIEKAHTGDYSVKVGVNQKAFEVNLKNGEHRADKYKISVWVDKLTASNARIHINGSTKLFNGETVHAGDWVLLNHYEDLSSGVENIYFTSSSGNVYFDDFRLLPIFSSMNCYVYNSWDELTHIIGSNGLATMYEYDEAGRLFKTYNEIEDDGTPEGIGGFKLNSRTDYNYKN